LKGEIDKLNKVGKENRQKMQSIEESKAEMVSKEALIENENIIRVLKIKIKDLGVEFKSSEVERSKLLDKIQSEKEAFKNESRQKNEEIEKLSDCNVRLKQDFDKLNRDSRQRIQMLQEAKE
jgi:hypothetical protein